METNSANYGLSKMKVETYDDENFINPLPKAVEKDPLLGIYVPSNKYERSTKWTDRF